MKLIKNILNPVICLAMGYTCIHFYDAGNYDSVILCFVFFVLWIFRYLEDYDMRVWALIDKYEGDIKAVLDETGKRNVEKQLMELGRKEVKEQIDNIEDFGNYGMNIYFHLTNLLNSDDCIELIDYTHYEIVEFNVKSSYKLEG